MNRKRDLEFVAASSDRSPALVGATCLCGFGLGLQNIAANLHHNILQNIEKYCRILENLARYCKNIARYLKTLPQDILTLSFFCHFKLDNGYGMLE